MYRTIRKVFMNSIKCFLFVLCCPLVFVQCQDKDTGVPYRELTVAEKKLVQSGNSFGFKLFSKVSESSSNQNVFISPLSVSLALGMTINGARNETYDAMRSTLDLAELTQEEINLNYLSLIQLLSGLDRKVIFEIANSIWYRNSLNVQEKFIKDNRTYFDAEVTAIDFGDPGSVGRINRWVGEKTHDKIRSIVDRIDPDLVMLLINAIYFKGTWTYEFKKEDTRDEVFIRADGKTTPCRMMMQSGEFNYHYTDRYHAVDLPYGDGDFSMTILLPHEGTDIDELIRTLDQKELRSITESFLIRSGTVEIPKFKLELKYSLNETLKALGMEPAFIPGAADFSGIDSISGKQLFISSVNHKTFVQVDEEGTEAAAVTSVGISLTDVGEGGFYFRADRPFVFFIRENRSQTVLFIGKVVNPG